MNDKVVHLWEEPLYRFILQITIAEIVFLSLIIVGVIFIRQARIVSERRPRRISTALTCDGQNKSIFPVRFTLSSNTWPSSRASTT